MSSLNDSSNPNAELFIDEMDGYDPSELDAFIKEAQKLIASSNALIESINNPTAQPQATPESTQTASIVPFTGKNLTIAKTVLGAGAAWALYEVVTSKKGTGKKNKK